ncbi:SH2 domain-containing protein 2A [Lissotriton helveticus]
MDFKQNPKKGTILDSGHDSHILNNPMSLKGLPNICNQHKEIHTHSQQSQPVKTRKSISDGVHSVPENKLTCCSEGAQSTLKHIKFTCTPWWAGHVDSQVCDREDPAKGTTSALIPAESLAEFQAETERWFKESQEIKILQDGEKPEWFHGFVTRREADELLHNKPLGCFLIRFCESKVGFVLSYRSTGRCRHFLLEVLPDNSYVILGEDISHASLQDLLDHYRASPIEPYHEFLTSVCSKKPACADYTQIREIKEEITNVHQVQRKVIVGKGDLHPYTTVKKPIRLEPQPASTLPIPAPVSLKQQNQDKPASVQDEKPVHMCGTQVVQNTEEVPNAHLTQSNVISGKGDRHPYSKVKKQIQPAHQTEPTPHPSIPASSKQSNTFDPAKLEEEVQAHDFMMPLPVRPHPTPEREEISGSSQSEDHPYRHARINETAGQDSKASARSPSAEHKYSFLVKFHTYTEPTDTLPPERHIYHEPHETIDFYAMGRGSLCQEENIYSEVELKQRKTAGITALEKRPATPTLPAAIPIPKVIANKASTLPPRSQWDPLAKEVSLQHRLLARSPSRQAFKAQHPQKPSPHFDDPIYNRQLGRSVSEAPTVAENIYERIPDEYHRPRAFSTFKGD